MISAPVLFFNKGVTECSSELYRIEYVRVGDNALWKIWF